MRIPSSTTRSAVEWASGNEAKRETEDRLSSPTHFVVDSPVGALKRLALRATLPPDAKH
jgi:hypothetical protein